MAKTFKTFCADESGATAIEYGLIAALVSIAAIGALTTMGSTLQTMDGVDEVVVSGQPHPLIGNIVVAQVKLGTEENLSQFRKRMREFCSARLARFKIPQKVELVDQSLHGDRFKKMRKS